MSLENLLDSRLLLLSGKGGVGKTTLSIKLAQHAAGSGKKVCLCSASDIDQIGPVFAKNLPQHELTLLTPNLYAFPMTSAGNFKDFITKHLKFNETFFGTIFSQKLTKSLIDFLPAVKELTLLGRLYHLATQSKHQFDLVIFDGFASGHMKNLLETPKAVMDSKLAGPISSETQTIIDFYQAKENCKLALVTLPEELPIKETIDFQAQFKDLNFVTSEDVIINKVMFDLNQIITDCSHLQQLKLDNPFVDEIYKEHTLSKIKLNQVESDFYLYQHFWSASDSLYVPSNSFLEALL